MNKFLDDISEYKIVNRLKEKLQESENLKMEIEAILIKRVFDDFKQWNQSAHDQSNLIFNLFSYSHRIECFVTGTD